jgi:adenylate cyclase
MQRKLTVILSADVVGYSGMMEADDAATLAALKSNRSTVFDPAVAAHGGRTVKLMGDGALVEFPSVVAAVECALAIQDATMRANAPRVADQPIRYRIGINLGEVIVEGDDLYGDGVNVAARLQALAPADGIAVSLTVRDQVAGKIPCRFEDLGEHTVKNIQRPVHVFVLHPSGQQGGPQRNPSRLGICVLPFANISGDAEQEYFSDGITEDIITDLSKVSALWVAARNTSFTFKGKHVDARQTARQLDVSHLLEGSVRKAGGRVRITAQLIDGASGGHVWAERYDRDLNDIFALQDEISQAIVAALRLKLLPEEKKAIEQRGTTNAEAYNLYLMARQFSVTGNVGAARRSDAIIRLCRRATEIDPDYARAWALMAVAQIDLRFHLGGDRDNGLAAAERALALDANLAEAHAARGRVLKNVDPVEARREIETALHLDPESYEVNLAAAGWHYQMRRIEAAIACYEKAAAVMDADYLVAGMLSSCYKALGDMEGARRAARRALERTEKLVAQEPDNGSAMGFVVSALAVLGESERAMDWVRRALILDPDNLNMRYNMACALVTDLHEPETALILLEPAFERLERDAVTWMKADPDLDAIREHPRFQAMVAAAEARGARKQSTPERRN